MDEHAHADQDDAVDRRRQQLELGLVAGLLADRELTVLADQGDLGVDELRRELDAVGPRLTRVPREAWEQFLDGVELHTVPGSDPPQLETTVPLWTATGPATRWARVRLVPLGEALIYIARITGFTDVVPPADWQSMPPDAAVVPPGPLEPAAHQGADPVPERWRPVLRDVVHRLVVGDYDGLQRDGVIFDVDVPGQDMVKHWIERQPEPLVDLPQDAWAWSNHTPADDGPGVYAVSLWMWTAHQGPSRYVLEGEVFDDGGDAVRVQVYSVTMA